MLSYLHRNSYDSVPLLAEKFYFDLSNGEAPDWFIESNIPEKQMAISSHSHSEPELIYVIRGNLQFNLNNQPLTISEGDLVIINPFDFHEAFFNRNETVEYCYLIFDLSCLSGCGNTVGDKLTALKYGKQRFPDVLCSTDSLTCAIGELIQHLCSLAKCDSRDGGSDDILKISLLCGIMSMLYDRIEPVSDKKHARDIGFIQRLTEYIDDNLSHPLTTASVSAEFGRGRPRGHTRG